MGMAPLYVNIVSKWLCLQIYVNEKSIRRAVLAARVPGGVGKD